MAEKMGATSFARPAHNESESYEAGCKADVDQASGENATACLPSRLLGNYISSSTPSSSLQSSSVIILTDIRETAMDDESCTKIERAAIFVGCGSFFFVCRSPEHAPTRHFPVTFDSKTDSVGEFVWTL
jgi:hypothetical protein